MTTILYMYKYQLTPIDPRDGALRPVDHRSMYRAGRRVQSTVSEIVVTVLATSAVAAMCYQHQTDAVAVYIALADGRRAVAKFSKSRIWNKVPDGSTQFFRYFNFF